MKSKFLLLVLSLGLVGSPLLSAQDPVEPSTPPTEGRRGKGRGPGDGPQGRGQMMNPTARVEQLDRQLSLTADQKTKLTEIFAKTRDQMEGMRGGGGGDREANREKLQSMMQATRSEVQAVLTDEQKKKFKALPEGPGGRGEKGERGERPKGGGGQGKRKKDV